MKKKVSKRKESNELNTGLLAMANEDEELKRSYEEERIRKEKEKKSFIEIIRSLSYKEILKLWILLFSILLFIILFVIKGRITDSLADQQASKRWDSGKQNAQVSFFISPLLKNADSDTITAENIDSIRYHLTSELNKIFGEEETEESEKEKDPLAGPYTYAYSGYGSISISASNDKYHQISNANAIGVGGDFFVFHPVRLLSGSYFDKNDLMKDTVLLDSNSAFKLFGSSDIVGMQVMIGNKIYYVSGVYEVIEGRLPQKAGCSDGFIFLYYPELVKNGFSEGISCLEFVSNEPYKGYLYGFMNDASNTGFDSAKVKVVENSRRFEFDKIWAYVISEWGARSMQSAPIVYPYWENLARGYEDICGGILIAEYVLFIIIMLILCNYFSILYKKILFRK